MRVWLDDERPMPSYCDVHVKTYDAAIELLAAGIVTFIDLDHDLGEEKTGYDVACQIEQAAHEGSLERIGWDIHTANQVGGDRMQQALRKADGYWDMWERKERTRI